MPERLRRAVESVSRNYSFLLSGVWAIWRSLLVMLLPATIALLIVVPLALLTKSAHVDIHVVTHRAAFTLLEGWQSGQDVELLHSAQVNGVRLWIDSLELSPKELIDEDRSGPAINTPRIQLRSRQDPHSNHWVEFKTKADTLLLSEIRLTTVSKVEIYKNADTVKLGMVPRDRVTGEISLNGPVSLIVNDYDIFDSEGRPLSGLEDDQQHFGLTPAVDPVHFYSKEKRVDLELELSGKEENFLGTFSDFLLVRGLAFPPGEGETAVPIEEGSVGFRDIEKPPIDLKSSFLGIPGDDVMEIVTIGAKSGALDLTASGRVRSLKTGRVPRPDNEELPNLLDWLYHNQKLGIIIGILVWVSGTVLGAVKLLGELKK
jgi:hypothetical protein